MSGMTPSLREMNQPPLEPEEPQEEGTSFFAIVRVAGICVFGLVFAMPSVPIAYKFFPKLRPMAAAIVYILAVLFCTLASYWYWNRPRELSRKLEGGREHQDRQL